MSKVLPSFIKNPLRSRFRSIYHPLFDRYLHHNYDWCFIYYPIFTMDQNLDVVLRDFDGNILSSLLMIDC